MLTAAARMCYLWVDCSFGPPALFLASKLTGTSDDGGGTGLLACLLCIFGVSMARSLSLPHVGYVPNIVGLTHILQHDQGRIY